MESLYNENKLLILRIASTLGILLAVFLLVATLLKIKQYRYVGTGMAPGATIAVTGSGKIEQAPDTAKFSFVAQDEQKDVATAQANVSAKVTKIKSDLLALGVADKYISTESYNSYPDYVQGCRPGVFCMNASSVLKGYVVSQNVSVNVKDLSKAEAVAGVLGKDGATSISGPNFGFEDQTAISRAARDRAIADAKDQAAKLAASLGVHLIRIVGFSESGGGVPVPMYLKASRAMGAADASAPNLPTGAQTVESTVTLTYEIR